MIELLHGDCLERLRELPDCSVDAIVTDPPYGLSFMGRKWDYDVPSVEIWRECLRVLKLGGHLLAFAGTRTQHRMAVNIEDAGFEIRDMIAWVYGSGFPKSMDISKAIDKAAGAKREVIGENPWNHVRNHNPEKWDGATRTGKGKYGSTGSGASNITAPATPEAAQWEGWGTALKPALEPITVARKPFKGTVAQNVLEHGTGGINVDGCRIAATDKAKFPAGVISDTEAVFGGGQGRYANRARTADSCPDGRWPANLIHDGSEEVVELFPHSVSTGGSGPASKTWTGDGHTVGAWCKGATGGFGDSGSAARFFYCAKASKADREDGNVHPTVKPTDLMAYLCRLVTPPDGIVLDPFMGSGSTGKAAIREGFGFIGIEREAEYFAIAQQRVQLPEQKQGELL